MSRHTNEKDFRSRLASALRRRLFPNSGLRANDIAAATGRSGRTVYNWLRGEATLSAEDVGEIARFFAANGDATFLTDLYGPTVQPFGTYRSRSALRAGLAAAERQLAVVKAQLAEAS